MKTLVIAGVALLAAAPAFAHVTVAPQQAPLGASQVYKVRVHNDGKTPTRSIALQIPSGVVVESVAADAAAKSETTKTGDRVTRVTWQVEVPVGKYVELAFTAKNPPAGSQLSWNVVETFQDGSSVEYTDKPGAKEKASITKLTPAPAAAPAR